MALTALTWLVALTGCTQDYTIGNEPPVVNPEDVTECAFTPIGATGLSRYDCNPVFTDSGEAWAGGVSSTGFHAEVVLGHPFYQMWYSASAAQGGGYGLGYAISADGTTWEPMPANPLLDGPTPAWRASSMDGIRVVWDSDESQYVLAYQGLNLNTGDNGIGFMTSPNGQDWTPLNNDQPVIDLTVEQGGIGYCWPLALTHTPGEGLRGYIAGGAGNVCEVYGFEGPNAASLTPLTTPILRAGPDAYDQQGMTSAAVAELDGVMYMFYVGIREFQPIPGTSFIAAYNTTLNLATSTDGGATWTKSPDNPLRDVGVTTNPNKVLTVAAQVVGPRIHLWIDDYYPELDRLATGYFLYEPPTP